MDNSETPRPMVVVDKEPPNNKDEFLGESDYGGSDELNSCSSTDEDELVSNKPKYSKFNKECVMKNPQFKIGMKFRRFKQFKGAIKNYGIRNRYVMNFNPTPRKDIKHFVRECTFYLWVLPMVKDGSTVQIKSGKLEHECTRDHNNRHVNADYIARTYLDQFRADPAWNISGIIQAMKTNQEVNINRLKVYRAKCKALR